MLCGPVVVHEKVLGMSRCIIAHTAVCSRASCAIQCVCVFVWQVEVLALVVGDGGGQFATG